jgi:hypothetical protein
VRQVLKQLLLSPRLAGYRVYQGGIAKDTDGNPVTGMFPPVLEVETWEAVVATITDPTRSSRFAHVGGRKYLLSGIARCAVCSKTLTGSANAAANTFSYSCKRVQTCGKVGISGPQTDALITKLVLAYLADREVQSEVEPWSGESELAGNEERLRELMDGFTSGELTRDVVFPAVGKLEDQAAILREERAVWLRGQLALTKRPTNVVEQWPSLDRDQQRQVIASVLHSVVVSPAKARGGRFAPDRISVVWN